MSAEIESWPRPRYKPGGSTPFLFYVVFGKFDLTRPLSRSLYHTSGLPDWLELAQYNRTKDAAVINKLQSGALWDLLKRETPVTATQAEQQPECIALAGEPTDPSTLDYFRDAIGVVTWLIDVGGMAVSDPQMLWLWSAEEWRDEVFAPGRPNPDRHTTIMVSEEADGTCGYHTRGMRKFGRPDLSVRGVGTAYADDVSLVIEELMEYQALGGVVAEGEVIKNEGLPPGGICRHGGSFDDPNFNNVHIELVWPPGELSQNLEVE